MRRRDHICVVERGGYARGGRLSRWGPVESRSLCTKAKQIRSTDGRDMPGPCAGMILAIPPQAPEKQAQSNPPQHGVLLLSCGFSSLAEDGQSSCAIAAVPLLSMPLAAANPTPGIDASRNASIAKQVSPFLSADKKTITPSFCRQPRPAVKADDGAVEVGVFGNVQG